MAREQNHLPGITLRSAGAILLGMLVMAVVLVFGETIDGTGWFYSMHTLAFPAVAAFLVLFGLDYGTRALFRTRLLTRPETVCVFFCLLFAAPLMGMGFWSNFVWLSSTIPAQGDFERIDAVSDRLWPHGPNLLADVFRDPKADCLSTEGNLDWRTCEYEEGRLAVLPVLKNAAPTDTSWLRVRVPLEKDGDAFLTLGERYLLSLLVRGRATGPETALYCRVYYDGNRSFDVEAFSQPQPGEKTTFLHKRGFQRLGVYGVEFADTVRDHVDVEFRLVGQGTVELADPKLMRVAAFETLFTGREAVSEAEYRALRPSERAAYAVRPDSPWSAHGLLTLLRGYVPVRDWYQPVATWLALIALLLLATFAVALVMRRQWVKNERYPLPMARIPSALLGVDDGDTGPAIWKNRTAWLGFSVCLLWCLLRVWHSYNPNVPNTELNVPLKPYFDDPGWGQMWNNVGLSVSVIVMSLAVFMELNVLLSLVLGFFLYRSLHWLGEANGWNIASAGKYGIGAYPYADEQLIGAYVTYGLLTLYFTRKYLWQALVSAVKGGAAPVGPGRHESAEERELTSYRAAFLMLALAFAGAVAWAVWAEIRPHAMLVLFGALVLFGFVAMKLRAECGTPFAWFTPGIRLLVPLLGGMAFFGAQGTMLAQWLSVGMVLLFILPGLQIEFIEVARRSRLVPRHAFYTLCIGVVGGMLIGGWFFLSSIYGIGANNVGMTYWFTARPWEFYPYADFERVADAAVASAGQASPADTAPFGPSLWGYAGASVATAAVTVLRQRFPGFWFHPIAVVLGGTAEGLGMQMYWGFNLWGSLLAAWAVRWTVLKLGGAAAVRNKLFPFFIGAFVAAVLAQALVFVLNGYFYFFDVTATRSGILL